ncbi:neurofilament heavy polypeptide-like isoform X2 [Ostrinia furnacalis]|uniref:neurofilament heavy polypeptide-like isoform X2 n=1 Tax=Ostrinia furnacalis TaxID=93504 RepID=UPI00103A76C3|nr:neurofilament heavy polypeptide-like isoform X2 [Ostrinia furnacalis]
MNSALKPVLPQPGVPQPGGQASPAKGNVASINHPVGLPQGAQNSLHHGTNNLVGQNLTHHAPAPAPLPHAVPSMAPVSANMAQMAQNMSHHGNLSHVTQNSVAPPSMAASPSKSASTSAPLSLVQDKANSSQPLALTRTPEKKEPDSTGQPNGIESPKSGANAPAALKPQNPETNKEKQDIAKTSPSTPKPPEKPSSAPNTPQKTETANLPAQTESPVQPKVATANEATEKPAKPTEPKPAPTADVAPTQSDSKPVPESANDSQLQEKVEKAPAPTKQEAPVAESAKVESTTKTEESKEVPKEDKTKQPQANAAEEKKEEAGKPDPPKEEPVEKPQKVEQPQKVEAEEKKVEEKKPETRTPAKAELKATPKSTLKLATVTPPMRKRRQASPSKGSEGPSSAKKPMEHDSTPDPRTKRNRTKVQLYQSPTPELAMATKLSASAGRSTPTKPNDDKLIVFYKNEYLAVRNAEGGFYVCQAMQNVYRTTRKIKIRWLSQDKAADASGETYKPDFYDVTDMECVLTTLSLQRAPGGGGAQLLKPGEQARAKSILDRALKAEQSGGNNMEVTEEHPDGLDLSLYTDESQLEKGRKRGRHASPRARAAPETQTEAASPAKKARTTPKRSPKSVRKAKPSPPKTPNNKRKASGSTPSVAATSKTATAVTEKAKPKATPPKRAAKPPSEPATPLRKGRRSAAKENKASPIVPTPSTSTGKSSRTPRKPPARK